MTKGKNICTQIAHYCLLPPAIGLCDGTAAEEITDTSAMKSTFVIHPCGFCLNCTHVDDRVLELDVEPVVRNGDDGFISSAKIFHPFPLKN